MATKGYNDDIPRSELTLSGTISMNELKSTRNQLFVSKKMINATNLSEFSLSYFELLPESDT